MFLRPDYQDFVQEEADLLVVGGVVVGVAPLDAAARHRVGVGLVRAALLVQEQARNPREEIGDDRAGS